MAKIGLDVPPSTSPHIKATPATRIYGRFPKNRVGMTNCSQVAGLLEVLAAWVMSLTFSAWWVEPKKKDLFLCINLTLEFKSILWLPLAVKRMTQNVGFWCVPEYFGFLPTDHTISTREDKLELHVNARLWFLPFASTGPSISFTWHAAISVWIYACLHKLRLITQARGVVGMSV